MFSRYISIKKLKKQFRQSLVIDEDKVQVSFDELRGCKFCKDHVEATNNYWWNVAIIPYADPDLFENLIIGY